MIFGEYTMALGHISLDSVVAIKKYNQLLIPKYNLS